MAYKLMYSDYMTPTGSPSGPSQPVWIAATPPSSASGSLWWDTVSGQLFVRYDDGNSLQWVVANSENVLTGALVGADPATATQLAPLWWDSESGQLFIQYNDGTSTQWVSANSVTADQLTGVFLPLTGGTVTGTTTFNGNPTFIASGTYTFADTSSNASLYIAQLGVSTNPLTIYPGGNASTVQALLRAPGSIQAQPGYPNTPAGFSVFANPIYSGTAWTEMFAVGGVLGGASTSSQPTSVCHLNFTDHVDMSGSTGKLINYFQLDAQGGGSTFRGGRQGIQASVGINVALSVPGGIYAGIVGSAYATASAGGTALTRTGQAGGFFGGNFYASSGGTAQNLGGVIGIEVNPAIGSGSTACNLVGIQVIPTTTHTVRGAAHWDTGYSLQEQLGAAPIDIGYSVGNSACQWPIRSDGSLFRGELSNGPAGAARHGILLNELSFPAFTNTGPRGGAFVSNGFAVDGTGAIQCGPGYLTPTASGITIDVTGSVGTGTPTVAAGGTGYVLNDVVYDDYGGVYYVTTVSGTAVSAVTVFTGANGEPHQPWCPSHTLPTNPVATTSWNAAGASGCTLNLSWDTSRNQLIVAPSGAPAIFGLPAQNTRLFPNSGLNWIQGAGGNMVIDSVSAGITFGWNATTFVNINAPARMLSTVGFNGNAAIAKPVGYTAPTGTATRATFLTSSVTLPVLAEHVKALIDDLTAYGLIGT